MLECELIGMQEQARAVVALREQAVVGRLAVARIANYRMPQVFHVQAQLMASAGQWPQPDEAVAARRVAIDIHR